MAKHLDLTIIQDSFAFVSNEESIAAKTALDGFVEVLAALETAATVTAYIRA